MDKDPTMIAEVLGEVYFIEKETAIEKNQLKDEFFKAIAASIKTESLATKVATAPKSCTTMDSALGYFKQYHPGWIASITENKGKFSATLQEDPDFIQESILVLVSVTDIDGKEHPGYVVTKEVRSGTAMLDIDRLKAEDLDLYYAITEIEHYILIADIFWDFDIPPEDFEEPIKQAGLPRVLKNPDELTDEQQAAIMPYSFEGPRVKALRVRYAKDDEGEE